MMRVEDALIFITSPNRTTTYHIDRECNFLLQISGSKTIHMFDQRDKDVVPETELEKFWAVDKNAGQYKPQLQDRATPYRLVPGNGIHIPINDPHWLQNDNNVSISLSVNFTLKDSERANIYRANYFMRKAGMHPAPPFTSPLKDGLKNAMMMSLVRAGTFGDPNDPQTAWAGDAHQLVFGFRSATKCASQTLIRALCF